MSKSKMAAIQGKNIRNGIGKTMFFSFCVDTVFPISFQRHILATTFYAELLVVNWTVCDELM
jgi:hypothetical protein